MRSVSQRDVPVHLQRWLFAQGSLTRQLTQLADGQFSVQVLGEYYAPLSVQDSRFLQTKYPQMAWVRESLLYGCESNAWVQAKSIIPIRSLNQYARQFKTLKQRPMGKLLFYRQKPQCIRRVFKSADGWVRQSDYVWRGCHILVQETFLNDFERFILR